MNGMFTAEFTVLFEFYPFRVVLLVFKSIIVSLFTFSTRQSNLISCAFCRHNAPSEHEKINTPNPRCYCIIYELLFIVKFFNGFFKKFAYFSPFFRLFRRVYHIL